VSFSEGIGLRTFYFNFVFLLSFFSWCDLSYPVVGSFPSRRRETRVLLLIIGVGGRVGVLLEVVFVLVRREGSREREGGVGCAKDVHRWRGGRGQGGEVRGGKGGERGGVGGKGRSLCGGLIYRRVAVSWFRLWDRDMLLWSADGLCIGVGIGMSGFYWEGLREPAIILPDGRGGGGVSRRDGLAGEWVRWRG